MLVFESIFNSSIIKLFAFIKCKLKIISVIITIIIVIIIIDFMVILEALLHIFLKKVFI